jgi:hypothetical protein
MQQSPVSAMPMRQDVSSMMGGAGGNMPQGIAAILAEMAAKNPQQPRSQETSQMRAIEGDDYMMPAAYGGPLGSSPLGAVFDPSFSNNPMQTATPMGPMVNSPFGLTPQFPMGGMPYDSTSSTTTQDMMGGNRGAPQTSMAANLSQMFNLLGQQQPAQQGGTPLQNGASPLQQSAKPVMNMGVM